MRPGPFHAPHAHDTPATAARERTTGEFRICPGPGLELRIPLIQRAGHDLRPEPRPEMARREVSQARRTSLPARAAFPPNVAGRTVGGDVDHQPPTLPQSVGKRADLGSGHDGCRPRRRGLLTRPSIRHGLRRISPSSVATRDHGSPTVDERTAERQ